MSIYITFYLQLLYSFIREFCFLTHPILVIITRWIFGTLIFKIIILNIFIFLSVKQSSKIYNSLHCIGLELNKILILQKLWNLTIAVCIPDYCLATMIEKPLVQVLPAAVLSKTVLLFYPCLLLFSYLIVQKMDVWGKKDNQCCSSKVNLFSICRTVHMYIFWTAIRNISYSSSLFSLQVFNIWLMKNHISG